MEKIGLVLEGGGLRGVYTNGALDVLMENKIQLPYCIGVSAGACNGLSYVSNQPGRNLEINMRFLNDKRYISFSNFLKEGSIFGVDMMLHKIPDELVPFDYDTYENSCCTLTAVATDCVSGQAVYYKMKNLRENYGAIQASASVPFVSKMVNYKGRLLLDGGLADSIPIERSIADGNCKNVVIATRHREYRKKPGKSGRAVKVFYGKYKNLEECLNNRANMYNRQRDFLIEEEQSGRAFVLYPSKPLTVGQFEKNRAKLEWTYNLGRGDMEARLDELRQFCKV